MADEALGPTNGDPKEAFERLTTAISPLAHQLARVAVLAAALGSDDPAWENITPEYLDQKVVRVRERFKKLALSEFKKALKV